MTVKEEHVRKIGEMSEGEFYRIKASRNDESIIIESEIVEVNSARSFLIEVITDSEVLNDDGGITLAQAVSNIPICLYATDPVKKAEEQNVEYIDEVTKDCYVKIPGKENSFFIEEINKI